VSTGYAPEIVSNKVAKELLAGRMAGPFLDPLPFFKFTFFSIGTVSKEGPVKMSHHSSFITPKRSVSK
jgi:hypothetical protein